MLPYVTIIVPTKNNEKNISACIKALNSLDYPRDRYEIIIVDGQSSDKTRQIAENEGMRVVMDEGKGRAMALNRAIPYAHGEYVAFTDPDCIPDKMWLLNLLKNFTAEEIAGVGGPNIVPEKAGEFAKAIEYVSLQSPNAKKFDVVGEVDSIAGCNSIYRLSIIRQFFPLPQVGYIEDTLLNYRIRRDQYKLVSAPDAIVWHDRHYSNVKSFFFQTIAMGGGIIEGAYFERSILRPYHYLIGFSIPLLFLISFALYLASNFLLVVLMGSIFIILFIEFLKGLYETKSVRIAGLVPFLIIIQMLGYSYGFMKSYFISVWKGGNS